MNYFCVPAGGFSASLISPEGVARILSTKFYARVLRWLLGAEVEQPVFEAESRG